MELEEFDEYWKRMKTVYLMPVTTERKRLTMEDLQRLKDEYVEWFNYYLPEVKYVEVYYWGIYNVVAKKSTCKKVLRETRRKQDFKNLILMHDKRTKINLHQYGGTNRKRCFPRLYRNNRNRSTSKSTCPKNRVY
jgi:hypothetical protein